MAKIMEATAGNLYFILTLFHILSGSIALVSGAMALTAKKGSRLHTAAGKSFGISMWVVCIAALGMHLPQGKVFLPSIAVFTLYMVFTGMRIFKLWHNGLKPADQCAAKAGLLMGAGMAVVSLFQLVSSGNYFNVVPMIFGYGFARIGYTDLRRRFEFRNYQQVLGLHMQRMTGAFIAAVTALLVVNAGRIPVLGETTWGLVLCWFLPSVAGSLYLVVQMRKISVHSKPGV